MAEPTKAPLLIVISAPSGGGKTTLVNKLLASFPDITRAITCTTRAPRIGEVEGVDYHFLDASAFHKHIQAGHFLEHATVYGNFYGTLKSEVLGRLRQGRDVLLNVDVQGVASICARAEEEPEIKRAIMTVFLTPDSLTTLETRLKNRGTDSIKVIQQRLAVAREEVAQWKHFDYLLISTTMAEDLRRMQTIIESEKMRTARALPPEFSF